MRWGALLTLTFALGSCRVPAPKAAEMLTVGFRSPRQTFESFRLALRGELQELEYNCWSANFKERNGLGQMTYREMRDQMMAAQGILGRALLARAMWKAEVVDVVSLGPRRSRLQARYMGHTLTFDVVREDFWEIWGGEARLDDGGGHPWEDLTEVVEDEYGNLLLQGLAPLKSEEFESRISELRIGQEWKLDGFSATDRSDDSVGAEP